MGRLILKSEVLEAIKKDGSLYGKVAVALDRTPGSLRKILAENDQKLTQALVLRIIKEHLGKFEDNEILEEISEPAAA